MYRHNIAYRFNNGQIQGFTGYAFNKEKAEKDAIAKIRYKLTFLDETFEEKNLINSFNGLDRKEIDLIKNDWKNQ